MPRLDLDDNDLAAINDALMNAPYGLVAPVIAKINRQITAQRQSPPAPPTDPPVNDS